MVDLRSDTISMPTREMLETILEAKLGDDGRTDSKGGERIWQSMNWRTWRQR